MYTCLTVDCVVLHLIEWLMWEHSLNKLETILIIPIDRKIGIKKKKSNFRPLNGGNNFCILVCLLFVKSNWETKSFFQ